MQKDGNPRFAIDSFAIRVGILALVAFLMFSVLVIRLWNMQIIRSTEYEYKDRKQSARRIRIPAMRGEILARDGTPIVRNRVASLLMGRRQHYKRARRSIQPPEERKKQKISQRPMRYAMS